RLSLTGDTRWQRMVAAGPAFRRSGASAMLDDTRHRILVYGGVDHGVAQNDVWSLSLDDAPTWTLLAPGGTPPTAHTWRQAVLDSDNDRLLVMGDSTVWALPLGQDGAWSQLVTEGASPSEPQLGFGLVFDPVGHRVLLQGGRDVANGYDYMNPPP